MADYPCPLNKLLHRSIYQTGVKIPILSSPLYLSVNCVDFSTKVRAACFYSMGAPKDYYSEGHLKVPEFVWWLSSVHFTISQVSSIERFYSILPNFPSCPWERAGVFFFTSRNKRGWTNYHSKSLTCQKIWQFKFTIVNQKNLSTQYGI